MSWMRGLIFVATMVLLNAAADAEKIKDWQVIRAGPGRCVAMDHAAGDAGIGVGVSDKMFMLVVWAPGLPTPHGDHDGTLSFDGKAAIPVDAYGYKDQLIISFDRGEQAYAVTHSSEVTVTANGGSHRYSLEGLAAAAEDVARCAGVPPLDANGN